MRFHQNTHFYSMTPIRLDLFIRSPLFNHVSKTYSTWRELIKSRAQISNKNITGGFNNSHISSGAPAIDIFCMYFSRHKRRQTILYLKQYTQPQFLFFFFSKTIHDRSHYVLVKFLSDKNVFYLYSLTKHDYMLRKGLQCVYIFRRLYQLSTFK